MRSSLLPLALALLVGCDFASSSPDEPGTKEITARDSTPEVPARALMDNGVIAWTWEWSYTYSRSIRMQVMPSSFTSSSTRALLEVSLTHRIPGDTVRLVVSVAESVWRWSSSGPDTTASLAAWVDTLYFDAVHRTSWSATSKPEWTGILHGQWNPPRLSEQREFGVMACGYPTANEYGSEAWSGESGVGTLGWTFERSECTMVWAGKGEDITRDTESLFLKDWRRP